MVLSDFSIRRPIAMVVVIIGLMALGLLALKNLRVNQIPDVEQPVLVVSMVYPGASPQTVESEILNRVEKPLLSIAGVYQLRSTASDNGAQIIMTFNFKKNMIEASDEVRNAIASIRYKLPAEMREPVLRRVDPSAQPIMQMALSSDQLSLAQLSRIAEDDLANRFRSIAGVAVVNVSGGLKRELSVLLRAAKLREYNLSTAEVVSALQRQNLAAPVGRLVADVREQSIRLIGRLQTPDEFKDVVLRRKGDELIRLGQVADISDGFGEVSGASLRDNNPNVGLSVIRSPDASTVSVAKDIRRLVEEINKELPTGTKLKVTRDGGKEAQNNLNNVTEALVFGAILTIFVVYLFLNSWRSTVITALSLPTSVITSFIVVWLSGFTLNFMTLLGLSLAIGVLIDDAIVVRENIVRRMASGVDRMTAARLGTDEIGLAVTATTFSIVAVFIPVAFMGGGAGEWFRPFALTVASSVLVSLFISFTLDPMLSAYWGDPSANRPIESRRGLERLLARFNVWFDRQADRYGNVISWALRHRRSMTLIAVVSLGASVVLQMKFGGSSFLPVSDNGTLAIDVRTPPSTSLSYARAKIEQGASVAHGLPETEATNSNVNSEGGRIYVDVGKSTQRERGAAQIAADLRQRLSVLVGAEYVVIDDLNQGARKPVQIQFSGPDPERLINITRAYMDKLREVRGAVDIGLSEQDAKDELQVHLRQGIANNLGVSVGDLAQTLRVAFAGIEVGDWVDPSGEARDVAVRLRPEDRQDARHLKQLPVLISSTMQTVPLGDIADISWGKSPSKIGHLDGKRTVTVSANVQGRSAGEVIQEAMALARKIEFPSGYGLTLGGAGRDQQEVFGEMITALIMGIGLMYLILVIQFGSFSAPVAVMLSLPLSLIGVVIALLLTGGTLNLMSLIGVIMLMGLVAKNAILLLDCTRRLEAQGQDREEALMQAGRLRLRPILMTTFALIAGMTPIAIGHGEGGEFYRPLAVAIIGGVLTATFLTLLVVPTFYDSIEIARDRAKAKFLRRSEKTNGFVAFVLTFVEALLALVLLRGMFRALLSAWRFIWRSSWQRMNKGDMSASHGRPGA